MQVTSPISVKFALNNSITRRTLDATCAYIPARSLLLVMFAEKDSSARTEWLSMQTHIRRKQHMLQAGSCDNKLICSGQAITSSSGWCSSVQFQGAMLDVLAENLLPNMAQSSKTNTTKNCQGRLDWRHFHNRISTTYATCVLILVNNSSQHAALALRPGCSPDLLFTVPEC